MARGYDARVYVKNGQPVRSEKPPGAPPLPGGFEKELG